MRVFKPLALATAIVNAGLAHPAFAQTESELDKDQASVLEEVIVTAVKRETNLMETSVAITALDQDALARNGITDASQIDDLVPNLSIALNPHDSGVVLSMRGVTSNNTTELGDPSVGFHVDGVYSPRPQGVLALLYDLDRIEALRGPQGTLYGRNATAGSVNVYTAKPNLESFEGNIEVEGGRYNQRQLRGTLNIPVSDTFALRANYFTETRDGWVDQEMDVRDSDGDGIPDTDQRRNEQVGADEYYTNSDREAYRLSALWEPSYDISIRATYENFTDKSAGGIELGDCEQNPEACIDNDLGENSVRINVPGNDNELTIESIRLHVSYELTEGMALEYNFGQAEQQRYQEHDADGGWNAPSSHPGTSWGWIDGDMYDPWLDKTFITQESDFDSVSHEIQLKSIGNGPVTWIAGYFNFEEDNYMDWYFDMPFCCSIGTPGGTRVHSPSRSTESEAWFGQATWHLDEQWHLTFGYRSTKDTKEDKGGRKTEAWLDWSRDIETGEAGDYFNGDWVNGSYATDHVNWGTAWSEQHAPGYTSADLTTNHGTFNPEGFALVGKNDHKGSWKQDTWRVGLDYDLDSDNFLFAYVATGFKAGGFLDSYTLDDGSISFFDYDPETLTNYEVGYKGSLLDGSMNLMVSAFMSDYKDKQVSTFRHLFTRTQLVPNPANPTDPNDRIEEQTDVFGYVTDNAAQATIKGVEVEFDWIPVENSRLTGYVAWLEAEYDDYDNASDNYHCPERNLLGLTPCAPDGETDLSGNRIAYTPEWSTTIAYEHSFQLGHGGTLKPWIQVHWESKSHFTDLNFDEKPLSDVRDSWFNIIASLRYTSADENWFADMWVYNLTNERVKAWQGSDNDIPFLKHGYNSPRSYGLRVGYSF